MLSGIRKQREILISLNDEIEQGINELRNISNEMKKREKVRQECDQFMQHYQREMPRVKKLQISLHNSVVDLEMSKFNAASKILEMKDEVEEYQKDLNETKPTLARSVLWL